MMLHATEEVETYAAAVAGFLEAQPVQRNVLLTVMAQARAGGASWSRPPGFWWLVDGGSVVGAASWTPPYPLLVSDVPQEASERLATAAVHRAARLSLRLPGVAGPASSARSVVDAAAKQLGAGVETLHRVIVHELQRLVDVPRPLGGARLAEAGDAALLGAWIRAFGAEAGVMAGGLDIDATVRSWLAQRQSWLWVDGDEPRSTATRYATAGVVRILAVYTPPPHRGRGYARRLVYEMSAESLATAGIHACTLNTDAANPVSNAIYRQIGYVPVAEHAEFRLVPA